MAKRRVRPGRACEEDLPILQVCALFLVGAAIASFVPALNHVDASEQLADKPTGAYVLPYWVFTKCDGTLEEFCQYATVDQCKSLNDTTVPNPDEEPVAGTCCPGLYCPAIEDCVHISTSEELPDAVDWFTHKREIALLLEVAENQGCLKGGRLTCWPTSLPELPLAPIIPRREDAS